MKKIISLGLLATTSVLLLSACTKEKEENIDVKNKLTLEDSEPIQKEEKTEDVQIEKDIKNMQTSEKDYIYSEMISIFDNLYNYPDLTQLGDLEYNLLLRKSAVYNLEVSSEILKNINFDNLNDYEKMLTEFIISYQQQEINLIKFIHEKYNKESKIVELNDDEKIEFQKLRNTLYEELNNNKEILSKASTLYLELTEYDDSKPFGYTTKESIEKLIEKENEENKEIIIDYISNIELIGGSLKFFDDKKENEEELNEIMNKLTNNSLLIKEMNVYKEELLFKSFIDESSLLYANLIDVEKKESFYEFNKKYNLFKSKYLLNEKVINENTHIYTLNSLEDVSIFILNNKSLDNEIDVEETEVEE